jgi:general secretion pathway protein E
MTSAALQEPPIVSAGAASVEFLRSIPRDFARVHLLLSQGPEEEHERLAVAPTTPPAAIINTATRLGRPVSTRIGDPETIAREIDRAYSERGVVSEATTSTDAEGPAAAQDPAEEIDRLLEHADRDLLSTQGKGPVVRLVDAVLFEALQRGASDVHVQPLADRALVRYRIDGVLHTMRELKPALANSVVSRIKVMGRMDIAERRVPQDGRAAITIGRGSTPSFTPLSQDDDEPRPPTSAARSIDLRISTLPTSYGERAVVRLLESSRGEYLSGFDTLGMPGHVRSAYLERASRASGIVLVTAAVARVKDHGGCCFRCAPALPPPRLRPQHRHHRGPDRIRTLDRWPFHQPVAGQHQEGSHIRHRAASHPPPGPRHCHGR